MKYVYLGPSQKATDSYNVDTYLYIFMYWMLCTHRLYSSSSEKNILLYVDDKGLCLLTWGPASLHGRRGNMATVQPSNTQQILYIFDMLFHMLHHLVF